MILLFIFLQIIYSFEIYIPYEKIVVFNTTNNQPFYINNINYRESINNIFATKLKNGKYNISTNNYKLYDGNLNNGNPHLEDIYIKSNELKLISTVYSYNKYKNYIYILASTFNPIPKNNKYLYFIKHNDNIIYKSYENNLNYFEKLEAYSGLNYIELYIYSNNKSCLCPSIENGYISNYQLVLWNETNYNNKVIINNYNTKNMNIYSLQM